MERRLAAILVADVVGYSRLMGADEAGTLARLTALRESQLEPCIAEHGGRVVKLMGDGFLVEFASVVDAVACALAWQTAVEKHEAGRGEDEALSFRIGINLGDVIVEGGDIYGDGVNVAARLEAKAEPGGICASRAVFEQVKNRLKMDHLDLGELEAKNIAEPIHAFRIRAGQGTAERRAPKPPRLEEARGSIAVFPFDSLSPDPSDAYLADGIATEIISLLSRIPDLRVASRPATVGARARASDVWQVVRDLQIRYVLTGSVRRAGERIRVTAELTETTARTQLWSHSYERQLADLFAVQDEIAEAIVIAFGGEYMRAEWRRARSRQTESLSAWELTQKAKSLNLPINRGAADEALTLAREAIEIDPSYAGGHAAVASILMQRVINGSSENPEQDRIGALTAVEQAADLAPDDPMVLRTLGNVFSNCGEHAKAVAALRRAVEIAPFDFHSWGRLGRTLAYGGDEEELKEGHAVLDRVLASAPNHPMVPYWHYFKANACMREGRTEDAVRFAHKSLEAQPGYAGAWVTLANGLGQLGRTDDARKAMERALKANPAMTPQHLADQISILSGGRRDEADKSLAGLKAAGLL
ncbi:MAG: tetratricopeptide repeat protein [Pseudomonadota bacterium]